MALRKEAEADQGENRYKERAEFERQIEARYRKPAEYGHLSILAYVDTERDMLVDAFWSWKQVNQWDGPIGQVCRQWEEHRFGAPLYDSAHQLLVFAVLNSLPPESRPPRYGRLLPNRTTQARKESLNEALDAITRVRRMPEVRHELAGTVAGATEE